MSTAITLQKDNETLGSFNSQKKSNAINESPNLLRLLPRALACKENASIKSKVSFNRSIHFVEVGELELQFQTGGNVSELHNELSFVTPKKINDVNKNQLDKDQPTTSSNVTLIENSKDTSYNGFSSPTSLTKSSSLENVISTFNKASKDSAIVVRTNSFPNSSLGKPEDQKFQCENPKPSTSQINGNSSRKRNLSDRGEQESQFPRVDRSTIYNTWEGCHLLNGNNLCGSGLINPLNNCFLNSVLQAVVHIPHLARMILDFKDLRMSKSNSSECFHCSLKGHITKAVRSNYPLSTNWIQPFLRKIFPHHRNGVQEDAHEMLTLLLGALEISPPKSSLNGLKVYGPSLSTPIEQIFVICNACKTDHINYERIREMNLGLTRTYTADIETLIDDFFKDEQLQNFYCSNCKKKQTATRHTFLLSAPTVLIIQLKRFNAYGGKNRTPVKPNKFINLCKHSFRQEPTTYQLHGLIQHIGGGINFGHYICAMRGFNNKDMFLFDDSERRAVPISHVMEKMEPYILFYTRHQISNNQIKRFPRRSFEGCCRPNYAKQARIENYTNNNNKNNANSFNGSSKMFNQTFGAFI